MELTREQIKEKTLRIKEVLGWSRVGKYKEGDLYLNEITDDGISHWGYVINPVNNRNTWTQMETPWADLTTEEMEMLEKFIQLRFPKKYEVKRNSYLIDFTNPKINETLSVDLKDKKFTKTYSTGRKRDVKYPHSFFKGMDGRIVASKIPADDNFKKLVETIIQKESACSNFGTFLIRLFDNIHLETYISAGIEFDYNIKVGYNFFDKDVRKVLNKHEMRYDRTVEQFFANDHDIGKSMLHHIKDEEDFEGVFNSLAQNMRDVNILVRNYKYDVGALFNYCKERNWTSGRQRYANRDLVSFICDYARMAELVWPNGFDKYPPNIVEWHDGASKLYEKEKINFDEKKYEGFIDEKMELMPKPKKDKEGNDKPYEDKDYCVIFPKSTALIQEEGRQLSHCVGSYIDYILRGQSIILFMRKVLEPNSPLITIEVKDGRISQARGKFNRPLEYEEKVFLKEFAEKKRLTYANY